jgi:polysaccharide biosynthesis protein PslH
VFRGQSITLARHEDAGLRAVVERLVRAHAFDVVHAEQLHSVPQCRLASVRGVPVVLRAQNVESDLWLALSQHAGPFARWFLQREARLLADAERMAVASLAQTITLSPEDTARFVTLSAKPDAVVDCPAPFPSFLPPAAGRLEGEPPISLFAGAWRPNRDGAQWFLSRVWPSVRARMPPARLHVFGHLAGLSIPTEAVRHGAIDDSIGAFEEHGILAVPLRFGSGIRMKILEAWSRGVPVVASQAACHGLRGTDEAEALVVANDAFDFAAAIEALARDPKRRRAIVDAGRSRLREHHDPGRAAECLLEVYAGVRAP